MFYVLVLVNASGVNTNMQSLKMQSRLQNGSDDAH